ncbi:MAG: ATP-binding protein [Clostridia bacterium]
MLWSNIESHDKAKRILRQQIKAGRIGHAYLFVGKNGIGKKLVARAFAADIMGDIEDGLIERNRHPDFKLWETDKKSIGVSSIRNLQEGLFLSPTQSKRKVVMINEGEKLTTQAQNALLKILEDPPEETTFLILVEKLSKILPTLISRCQILRFAPLDQGSILKIIDTSNLGKPEEVLLLNLGQGSINETNKILAEVSLHTVISDLKDVMSLLHNKNEYGLNIKASYLAKKYDVQFILGCLELIWGLALRDDDDLYEIIEKDKAIFKDFSRQQIANSCKLIMRAKKDEEKYLNKQLILETLLIELLEVNYD